MKNINLKLSIAVLAFFTASSAFSQDYGGIVKGYLQQVKGGAVQTPELLNLEIINTDNSESMKGNVIKFQQIYKGHPVYNSVGTALVRNTDVVYFTDNFETQFSNQPVLTPTLTISDAFSKASQSAGLTDSSSYQILPFGQPDPSDAKFARQRLLYFKDNADLKLAYEFTFPQSDKAHYWHVLIDAKNGAVLEKNDLNLSCTFHHDAYSREHTGAEHVAAVYGPENFNGTASALLAPDAATYNVLPFPVEAPTFGNRSLAVNPWGAGSPEGWHYDGTNRYTITRGNNVHAYEDTTASNTPGFSPDGGPSRVFDYPWNENDLPGANMNASITNLFYANNKVHDIFYQFGFTETARNFQAFNFGLGGAQGDAVNAEAQDGTGLNNANFATPQDGSKPRMQMYLWNPRYKQFLFYNAPVSAQSRKPVAYIAQFGAPINTLWRTGDVKVADVINACTPLAANSMTGKIGLVERGGGCSFTVKVKNVQEAGGIGAIVYSNPGVPAGPMGGTDSTIYIPSIMVDNLEGEFMKTQIASGTTVNVTIKDDPAAYAYLDGSFDNGVIIHEYGHGISNRNTGNGYSCLSSSNSKEQMGEGWSDFFALMLTNRPGDNASIPRGMATYVAQQTVSGVGIRPARYSPVLSVNPYKYNHTNGMEYTNSLGQQVPDVHSIGFVWSTILWDLHWKYVEKYGYASDVTANPTSGSARVLQLVMDGLKLQECNPTFVSGRNAILAAELASPSAGADKCMIWNVFANRGVGLNASAGSKLSINDQVADSTVPSECVVATKETSAAEQISIYPNPAKNEFFIKFPTNMMGKAKVEIYDAAGRLVMSEDKVSTDRQKSFGTEKLSNGVYVVTVKGLGLETSSKLLVRK